MENKIAEIKNKLESVGIKNPYIDIQNYRYRDFRDFFDKKEDLFELMRENLDDVEFFEFEELRYNLENIEITDSLFDSIKDWFELKGDDRDWEEPKKYFIGKKLGSLLGDEEFEKLVNEFMDDELDTELASSLFDYENYDYYRESNGFESLAYWTIYWSPQIEDVELALKCGLVPFKYDGEFLLALGGCGMDLSPKLDAYMGLAWGQISKDSQLFRQKDYFEYVVGKSTTEEVLKEIKLNEPKVKISYTLNEDSKKDE